MYRSTSENTRKNNNCLLEYSLTSDERTIMPGAKSQNPQKTVTNPVICNYKNITIVLDGCIGRLNNYKLNKCTNLEPVLERFPLRLVQHCVLLREKEVKLPCCSLFLLLFCCVCSLMLSYDKRATLQITHYTMYDETLRANSRFVC